MGCFSCVGTAHYLQTNCLWRLSISIHAFLCEFVFRYCFFNAIWLLLGDCLLAQVNKIPSSMIFWCLWLSVSLIYFHLFFCKVWSIRKGTAHLLKKSHDLRSHSCLWHIYGMIMCYLICSVWGLNKVSELSSVNIFSLLLCCKFWNIIIAFLVFKG